MIRVVLVAALAMSLQACARSDHQPSYLGAGLLDDDEETQTHTSSDPHPELRHIGSNKVLGAMAFQKVTGRTVDPSRLQSRSEN